MDELASTPPGNALLLVGPANIEALQRKAADFCYALVAQARAQAADCLAEVFAEIDRAIDEALAVPQLRSVLPPEAPARIKEAVRQSVLERADTYLREDRRKTKVARARAERHSRPRPVIADPVITPITCQGPPSQLFADEARLIPVNGTRGR